MQKDKLLRGEETFFRLSRRENSFQVFFSGLLSRYRMGREEFFSSWKKSLTWPENKHFGHGGLQVSLSDADKRRGAAAKRDLTHGKEI